MENQQLSLEQLSHQSTEELKDKLLQLTQSRDAEPLSQKVQFSKTELAPIFEELSRRNPFPSAQEQASLVPGVWLPVWSTIPFQDTLPGRVHDQCYQIFHDDGYYANIARYALGNQLPVLKNLSSLFAYDLMLIQQYKIQADEWVIQNVGIKQAFRLGTSPLTITRANRWFTQVVESKQGISSQTPSLPKFPFLSKLNQKISRQLKGASQATPQFEHLYIDHNFRLVKTKREAKQRPSYTIAIRKQ
ncbi:MAG: hypothetical protein BRC47_15625 [Cyanobacteria bacterium QS_7_48_42]|nr:MAG: hypothetical protein BRC34_03815 [Cyanobacteria bacterium QH_1_48_107]PSO99509.1 MAG: hypothetical protein BRC47_15625 [Cyanobacteria bacterium QS_7_48_42]PSP35190.1 MAG: hypothetical protein BRC57_08645 [Cyanobacteria bacterium QS_8_48_54]